MNRLLNTFSESQQRQNLPRSRCHHQMSVTLNCQQIAVAGAFVLMTCFSLTSTAPTTASSPLLSSFTDPSVLDEKSTPNIQMAEFDDARARSMRNPIFTTSSPVSSGALDIATMTATSLERQETSTTQSTVVATRNNNGMMETSTTNGNLMESTTTPSQDSTTLSSSSSSPAKSLQNMMSDDEHTTTPTLHENIQQLMLTDATTEKPIKHDADNFAVEEHERASQMPIGGFNSNMEKKMKMKENKKKALKADKKLKMKQKIYSDSINHPTIVPTNEPSDAALERVTQPTKVVESTSNRPLTATSTSSQSEVNEATIMSEPATTLNAPTSQFPTSIKTAPTTIKSTTRTTIKTTEMNPMETTTLPYTAASTTDGPATDAATESPLAAVHNNQTSVQQDELHQRNDNVIVLNTNNSGLIVVDIMDNFGVAPNATETIEIKMDLMDDVSASTDETPSNGVSTKDDIFFTTVELTTTSAVTSVTPSPPPVDGIKSEKNDVDVATLGVNTTPNDDIILINVNGETMSTSVPSTTPTTPSPPQIIKWNQVKNGDASGNIKIKFDNVDLSTQNVNVSIENGELVIDSIDIGVLNRAEEVFRKSFEDAAASSTILDQNKTPSPAPASDSLEIELIEDDSEQPPKEISRSEESNLNTQATSTTTDEKTSSFQTTTIHFDIPTYPLKHDHSKKIELSGSSGDGEESEDGIKIKTTDKDSDTIFYMSNAEVKVIESIPTASPTSTQTRNEQKKKNKKFQPATMFEEDVSFDGPATTTEARKQQQFADKYEEDIILSPLTSPFDPKDINYIGEAFLDVEESQNGMSSSESRHIIPLTSDVVIQPASLRDSQILNGIPIIGEIPPQIELEEMVFNDDYEGKQFSNIRFEELFLNSRMQKNSLEADVPKETILDTKNFTIFPPNRTHITINTININGTIMTTNSTASLANGTARLVENEEMDMGVADLTELQTVLFACFATLTPLSLCVIIALTIRYCYRKYHNEDSSGHDLTSDKSTDPLAGNHVASTDDLKSAESGMKLGGGGNMGTSTELLLTANGEITPTNHNGNGSIITMTLKNNHLIVETEERNDLSRDTRETKMHYSPSDKDGVFIVEAARGADQNGSHKPSPLQQKPNQAPLVMPEEIKIDTLQSHFSPSSPEEERKQAKAEQVEVHTPPADLKENDGKSRDGAAETTTICNGTKTGLSQSDLSLTSSNGSNQNYSYGDKDTYQCEEKGYKGSSPKRVISVHSHDLMPVIENSPPTSTSPRPVVQNGDKRSAVKESDRELVSKKVMIESPAKVHKPINGMIKNGLDDIISVPDENSNDAPTMTNGCHKEINNMDSLSFPAPPDDVNDHHSILELTSMDSLPPPPPEMTIEVLGQS